MYASKFPTERSPVAKCVMIVVVDRVNKLLKEWGVSPALPARTRYVLIEIDDISPNKLASIEEVEIQSAAWGGLTNHRRMCYNANNLPSGNE